MGPMKTLLDVISELDEADREATIYASKPWTNESTALVAREPETGGLPPRARDLGLDYFLEVFIASEFLEDWIANLNAKPSAEQKCHRLIGYAVNDA
jgi:hypothetical protein